MSYEIFAVKMYCICYENHAIFPLPCYVTLERSLCPSPLSQANAAEPGGSPVCPKKGARVEAEQRRSGAYMGTKKQCICCVTPVGREAMDETSHPWIRRLSMGRILPGGAVTPISWVSFW